MIKSHASTDKLGCEKTFQPQKPMKTQVSKPLKINRRKSQSRSRKTPKLSLVSTSKLRDSELKKRKEAAKPFMSAASWVATNRGKKIAGYNEDLPREIASLTKIATCIVVLRAAEKHSYSLETKVNVSERASRIHGTSAELKAGDELSVHDLLFALMLPSGNDAALVLAEEIGKLISEDTPYQAFISEMNQLATELKLGSTSFTNPHGMSTSLNISTSKEIAALAYHGLKYSVFKAVCSTTSYTCEVVNSETKRRVTWTNTNQLLNRGFDGLKTGTTPSAGPCLCSYIKQGSHEVIIVLLNCHTISVRWGETTRLWKWLQKYFLGSS